MNGFATESVRCTGNNGRKCGRDIKYFGHFICRNGKRMRWQTHGSHALGHLGILCGRLYILPGLFKRSVCHYRHVFPVHPAVCGILGGNRTTVPVSDSVGKKIPQPLPETQAPAGRMDSHKKGMRHCFAASPSPFPMDQNRTCSGRRPSSGCSMPYFSLFRLSMDFTSESYTPGYTDPGPP